MARNSNSKTPSTKLPEDMLARHHAGWDVFTRFVFKGCIGLAVLLLLMLLFLRIM